MKMVGRGLDVSDKFYLEDKENVRHAFVEPDNFYTLKDYADYESLDFIYSKNFINNTKFFKVLLKEWFYFVKKNGRIIIEMENNNILNFSELKDVVELVLGDKTKITKTKDKSDGGTLILKKTKDVLKENDDITKWTFGILSHGAKIEKLEEQIQSIIDLEIPNFEIIVCGQYSPKKKYKKYVKVIPFEPKVAWITKKKNMIVDEAKYENLVITHNRFVFDENWYEGMKIYGNYFEVITCKILSPSGRRAGDWLTYGVGLENRWYDKMGLMEYRDWDENVNINGSFYIIKKSTCEKCPWDESLVWGQREDDKLSYEFRENGIVPRFNPFSTVHTFPERYGNWNWKYTFNKKELGKIPFKFSMGYFKKMINYLIRKHTRYGIVVRKDYETYGWD